MTGDAILAGATFSRIAKLAWFHDHFRKHEKVRKDVRFLGRGGSRFRSPDRSRYGMLYKGNVLVKEIPFIN